MHNKYKILTFLSTKICVTACDTCFSVAPSANRLVHAILRACLVMTSENKRHAHYLLVCDTQTPLLSRCPVHSSPLLCSLSYLSAFHLFCTPIQDSDNFNARNYDQICHLRYCIFNNCKKTLHITQSLLRNCQCGVTDSSVHVRQTDRRGLLAVCVETIADDEEMAQRNKP